MIDIPQNFLLKIKEILKKHAPNCEVKVFGSRIKGTAKKNSDIDLVLYAKEKIEWQQLEAIKEAFSKSNIPYIVDIVDYHDISQNFQNIISKNAISF